MTPLFTEEQIATRMTAVAEQVVAGLGNRFIMVPILTGGFIFAADLARALFKAGADPEIDFLHLSSYGSGRESSGLVKLLKDLSIPVSGERVLLVDDVLDSGRSLYHAKQLVSERGAAAVQVCVAVDKVGQRAERVSADYALFEAGADQFLVGYGMDDAGGMRGAPDIGIV